LRIVGALLMTHAAFGYFWPPMHQRAVLAAGGATLTDTLHVAWMIVTGFLFVFETGFGAAAFGRRFRLFSIATMAIALACGALTGTYASGIQADLPTPWVGVWERLSAVAYMVWIAALAAALLRAPEVAPRVESSSSVARPSAFQTREAAAGFLAASARGLAFLKKRRADDRGEAAQRPVA
jgi:hypothetical protein